VGLRPNVGFTNKALIILHITFTTFQFYFTNTAWISDPMQGGPIYLFICQAHLAIKSGDWNWIISTNIPLDYSRMLPPPATSRIPVLFTYRALQCSLTHAAWALGPKILPWIFTFSLVDLRKQYLSTTSTSTAFLLMIQVFVLSMFQFIHLTVSSQLTNCNWNSLPAFEKPTG
jgi:hypothetical protein